MVLQSLDRGLDALNILAKHPDWLKKSRAPKILTPHMGEMVRLSGVGYGTG